VAGPGRCATVVAGLRVIAGSRRPLDALEEGTAIGLVGPEALARIATLDAVVRVESAAGS